MVAVALCVLFVLACGSDNSKELTQPSPTAPASATTSAPPPATATPAATGSSIAFVSMSDTSPYGHDEIYVMDADGSNQIRLMDNPGDDRYPSWRSPVQ
jgi:hypothetical protein